MSVLSKINLSLYNIAIKPSVDHGIGVAIITCTVIMATVVMITVTMATVTMATVAMIAVNMGTGKYRMNAGISIPPLADQQLQVDDIASSRELFCPGVTN